MRSPFCPNAINRMMECILKIFLKHFLPYTLIIRTMDEKNSRYVIRSQIKPLGLAKIMFGQ